MPDQEWHLTQQQNNTEEGSGNEEFNGLVFEDQYLEISTQLPQVPTRFSSRSGSFISVVSYAAFRIRSCTVWANALIPCG
jgi:hypothetical protein